MLQHNNNLKEREDIKLTYDEFMEKYSLCYEILYLKHNQGKTYQEIANDLNRSKEQIGRKYRLFLFRLYKCYYLHLKSIGIVLDASDILGFYENTAYAAAYLEKTYNEPLNFFRHGKPPVLLGYVKNFPPYRELTNQKILNLEKKVLEAWERQNKTFADIGRDLKITSEKARSTYENHYFKKVRKAIELISPDDLCFMEHIFNYSNYSHKRWELIVREYADFVQDLIE